LLESINAAEKRYKNELRAENTETPIDGWRVHKKNFTFY
jgi:hypothetical protein